MIGTCPPLSCIGNILNLEPCEGRSGNRKHEKTTNESGEYAYIYIDNYFVGNNPGRDGKLNKRNNFTKL